MKTKLTFSFSIFVMFSVFKLSAQTDETKAYNNYDFIPGEKILFEDNFFDSQDGEFPARWNLLNGQGVVNKDSIYKCMVLTDGNFAKVEPAMKTVSYLGSSFTVEFDFKTGNESNDMMIFFKDPEGDDGRSIFFSNSDVHTGYFEHDLSGKYPFETLSAGWHHAALAFKNQQIKCYVDQNRVLVVPKCGFDVTAVELGGIAELRFTNVKIAEGGGMNMLDKILTDGKFISHAVKFAVGKSTVKGESMGFLNELAKWLKTNATVKLEIGGHTDSDGDDASNLKLSQERADAVKKILVSLGIDASRLTSKGYGETKPVDSNATPEGKSNNRRVEFLKK